jgi:hypothetical protein
LTAPVADHKIARTEPPGQSHFIKEQVMRNVCLSTLGRVLVFAGVILLGGMVRPAAAEDETQACNTNGQAIAYGDVRAGCAIEVATDQDIFTFQGAAGDHAAVVVTETPAGPGILCAEVRGPDNSLLAAPTCAIPGVRFNIGPLSQTGIHQIIVFEQNNDSTLTFNVSVERLTPPRSPVPVAPGDVLLGREILPATDLDVFAFNAAPGDIVRVIVTEAGPEPAILCAEVRRPDNSVLAALTCGIPGVQFDLGPLTQSGIHQVIVSEQNNDGTLSFNLSLNCLSGTCASRPPTCFVEPSYAGNTLTLDFTIGTPEPAEWHLAMLAVGSTFTLWKAPLPVIEPSVTAALPIPGFPALGTIGFLSTFTTESGLVCTDLRLVDTGPMPAGMTPTLLRQYFPQAR